MLALSYLSQLCGESTTMEEPARLSKKSLPSSLSLSRYYNSAALACINGIAFASSCTMDISPSPDVNRKPAQSSPSCTNNPDFKQPAKHGDIRSRNDCSARPEKGSENTPSSHRQLALHYRPPSPCSICGKSLQIGLPSRRLSFSELKQATEGFSRSNFLSEGASSFVYKGILSDGKQVAVKSVGQRTGKFLSELQILGSVQHPNVISLVGYCSEATRALLVYDFICNGTLDWHLSARNPNVVPWSARRNIAIQVARGLRFLHECQLGCLVHRDIRAGNILLTHDYTPVIAGFSQAKWTQVGEEDHLLQTSAQEPNDERSTAAAELPAHTERPTEKTDVYAFGVLLLELISGRKVMARDHNPQDPTSLAEWARAPLVVEDFEAVIHWILDPRLGKHYKHYELFCMVNAASMCIRKDSATRPRMKQILSCLEDARNRHKGSTPLMHFVRPNRSASASSASSSSAPSTAEASKGGRTCTNQASQDLSASCNAGAKSKKGRNKSALTVTWQQPQMVSIEPGCDNKSLRIKPKQLSYSELL